MARNKWFKLLGSILFWASSKTVLASPPEAVFDSQAFFSYEIRSFLEEGLGHGQVGGVAYANFYTEASIRFFDINASLAYRLAPKSFADGLGNNFQRTMHEFMFTTGYRRFFFNESLELQPSLFFIHNVTSADGVSQPLQNLYLHHPLALDGLGLGVKSRYRVWQPLWMGFDVSYFPAVGVTLPTAAIYPSSLNLLLVNFKVTYHINAYMAFECNYQQRIWRDATQSFDYQAFESRLNTGLRFSPVSLFHDLFPAPKSPDIILPGDYDLLD